MIHDLYHNAYFNMNPAGPPPRLTQGFLTETFLCWHPHPTTPTSKICLCSIFNVRMSEKIVFVSLLYSQMDPSKNPKGTLRASELTFTDPYCSIC